MNTNFDRVNLYGKINLYSAVDQEVKGLKHPTPNVAELDKQNQFIPNKLINLDRLFKIPF